ncbi:MAG: PIN domain-containing protein [Chthoniobacterales bacterium]
MSSEDSPPDLPIGVVLDANIYYGDPALRGADALALLYFLKQARGRLVLPEIVEREIEENIREEGGDHSDNIKAGLNYFGRLQNRQLDSEEGDLSEWVKAFRKRLLAIDPLRIAMSRDHLRSAAERVIKKEPPSGNKGQQFKDCLVWEATLEAASNHSVLLVTNDGDFQNPSQRPKLEQEASRSKGGIKIIKSLRECLTTLKAESESLDPEQFVAILDTEIRAFTAANAKSLLSLSLDHLEEREVKFYPVEATDRVAAEFQLVYTFKDLAEQQRPERAVPHVTITGSCFYMEQEGRVSNIRVDSMLLDKTIVDGQVYQVGVISVRAHAKTESRAAFL